MPPTRMPRGATRSHGDGVRGHQGAVGAPLLRVAVQVAALVVGSPSPAPGGAILMEGSLAQHLRAIPRCARTIPSVLDAAWS